MPGVYFVTIQDFEIIHKPGDILCVYGRNPEVVISNGENRANCTELSINKHVSVMDHFLDLLMQ